MKIVATSDTHGHLPQDIPECDLFIHAGDFTPVVDHSRQRQMAWVNTEFTDWIHHEVRAKAKYVVGIAGNHDFVARTDEKLVKYVHWSYLNNQSVEIEELKIWGSPYSGQFGNWAFMAEENELAQIWKTIPDDTNIIVVHGPPYGYGDHVAYSMGRDPHVGSKSLLDRIDQLPDLKLVICGHIHEASGVWDLETKQGCQIANVSYVDLSYKPRGVFYNFDIDC